MRVLLIIAIVIAVPVIAFYAWFWTIRGRARRQTRAFDELAWKVVESQVGVHKRLNRMYASTGPNWEVLGVLTLSDQNLVFQVGETRNLLVMPIQELKCGYLRSPFFVVAPVDGTDTIAFNIDVYGQGREYETNLWKPFWKDLLDATAGHVTWAQTEDDFENHRRQIGLQSL